jgi:hypothetical protein
MKSDRFEYLIDAEDVIVAVNERWIEFAEENEGSGLGDAVIGTWLWQHMAGLEVKHLYRSLLERIRETGREARIPFRCDAPGLVRDMVLEVTPLKDGSIRFSSWIDSQRARPNVRILEVDREVDPERFARMCAWCKKIDIGKDDWRELEKGLVEAGLMTLDPVPKITHAVCSSCQDLFLEEISDSE